MQNLAGGNDVEENTKIPKQKPIRIAFSEELFETVLMQHCLKLIIIWKDINM